MKPPCARHRGENERVSKIKTEYDFIKLAAKIIVFCNFEPFELVKL